MPQDINDMMFCNHCKMNAYPSRPKFNSAMFGVLAVIIFIIVAILFSIFSVILSEIMLFLWFMWGFMIFNPYLLYYGIKKKQYCPRCYLKLVEKNLEYQPFGNKEPEVFKQIRP